MLNEKISNGAEEQSEALTDCNQHPDENRVLVVDQTQIGIQDTLVTWKNNKRPCSPVSPQEKK